MLIRKAAGVLGKVAMSPMTTKIVRGVRTASDIANVAGVPLTGAISKGLGVAEKILGAIQSQP